MTATIWSVPNVTTGVQNTTYTFSTWTVTNDPKDAYEKPLVEGEVPPSVEEPTDVDLEDDAPDPVEE